MDWLTFIKKKEKTQKNYKEEPKANFKKQKQTISQRVETQADFISKKQKISTPSIFPIENYELQIPKYKISCKIILKTFITIQNHLQHELEQILENSHKPQFWKYHEQLLSLQLFRYRRVNKEELLQNYSSIIQGCQLLYSKLHNNQRVKDAFYVKDQQDFLLFFKQLFGKPYTLCNLPSFRKILQNLWERELFNGVKTQKIIENLQLWIHGISAPINPSSLCLSRLLFKNPEDIPKYINFLKNDSIYHDINQSDCLGLTPILIAAQANLKKAFNHIIKCHSDLYLCPLTITKGQVQKTIERKNDKTIINIQYPAHERKQFNLFEILVKARQYQEIINILSFSQVRKLKDLKRDKSLHQKISLISDCSFQIHWKTSQGILSFKKLPKDIITVYKKGGFIRIDYHIDNLEKPINGHYSILLKTFPNKKMEYYFLNHHEKKIVNLMKEIDSQKLKMRYENITNFGNIEQQRISSIKSIYKEKTQSFEANIIFSYENILKADRFNFSKLVQYEKTLINSDTIDYSLLDKSEKKSLMTGKIGKIPKVKDKIIKQTASFKAEFAHTVSLTLHDLLTIFSILDKKSILFLRFQKIFSLIASEPSYQSLFLDSKFPSKVNFNIDSDFSIQIETKNFFFGDLDQAVFALDYRAKQLNFQETNEGLESLQETILMEESYSISVSQFLGKTQKLLQIQDQEANTKFQQMLNYQVNCFYEEEDK